MKTRSLIALIVFLVSWALLPRLPLQAQVMATGGNQTNDFLDYRIHVYTEVGEHVLTVSEGGEIDLLVVAGGGGGGMNPKQRWWDRWRRR